MAVTIPTAINLHTAIMSGYDRLPAIGSITDFGLKTLGNLPMTTNAADMQIGAGTGKYGHVLLVSGVGGAGTSTYDVSSETKLMVSSNQFNAPNRMEINTQANGGVSFYLFSGSDNSNYRSYYIYGNDTPAGSSMTGPVPFVIDMNATADHANDPADTGTFDNTDITAYSLVIDTLNQGGTTSLMFWQRIHVFDTVKNGTNIVKFTGTSDYDDIILAVLGTDYTDKIGTWVQQVSNLYIIPVAFQIGDTSTTTNFDDGGATVIMPGNADANDPRYRYTTQGARVYVVLPNSATTGTCDLSGTYIWGVASPWDLDQNDAAVITIDGASFSGMGDFTVGSSVTGAANFALASGSNVIISGGDLDGSYITGNATLDVDTDFTDIYINGNLDITIAADTVLDFSNVTVTGNVTNSAGSNTLTINASNGSSLTAGDAGTGNGETNVVNAVTLTVTVKDTSGSNIENARVLLEAEAGGAAPSDDSVTVSNVTTTATVTHTAHGMSTNDWVVIRGADDEYYNGIFQITVTTANAYTYTMSGTPTVDTGTITATQSYINELTNASGIATENVNFGTDQPVRGVARKSSASPFYRTGSISGTITSSGFSTTITLISDE